MCVCGGVQQHLPQSYHIVDDGLIAPRPTHAATTTHTKANTHHAATTAHTKENTHHAATTTHTKENTHHT